MNLDLIICRNVTIYFDEATTRQIVQKFYQCLNTEGWLVVGHAEPLVSTYREFTPHNLDNAVIYQKLPLPVVVESIPVGAKHKTRIIPVLPEQKLVTSEPQLNILQEACHAADREDWNALEHWLKAAERNCPMNPHTHYLRSLMFIRLNETALALDSLRRAVYCDPAFSLAHYVMGEIYEKRGRPDEARRCWLTAKQVVRELDGQMMLAPECTLTVEMFRGLLDYRLTEVVEK